MSTRCDLTDLLVDQCAHCKKLVDPIEEERALRRELIASGQWRESNYPGKCARCGEWFALGAPIQSAPEGGWVSQCCADSVDGAA